jgi:hypothetical protein
LAAHVVGTQPHLFGVPPPPHVFGAAHVPQSRLPPQPSETTPHSAPSCAQVFIVQPQTFASPAPPHDCGDAHEPQASIAPQPFAIMPQFLPCIAQVMGLQPHLLSVPPPPQVAGAVQMLGQVMILPQVSDTVPHSAPWSAHDLAMQGIAPHRFGPSPPHMRPVAHVPQSIIPPQPSGTMPQLAFAAEHVVGVQPHL